METKVTEGKSDTTLESKIRAIPYVKSRSSGSYSKSMIDAGVQALLSLPELKSFELDEKTFALAMSSEALAWRSVGKLDDKLLSQLYIISWAWQGEKAGHMPIEMFFRTILWLGSSSFTTSQAMPASQIIAKLYEAWETLPGFRENYIGHTSRHEAEVKFSKRDIVYRLNEGRRDLNQDGSETFFIRNTVISKLTKGSHDIVFMLIKGGSVGIADINLARYVEPGMEHVAKFVKLVSWSEMGYSRGGAFSSVLKSLSYAP